MSNSFNPLWGGYGSNFYFDGANIYFAANDSIHGQEPWIFGGNVGIQSVNQDENNFLLYPNPATDFFNLQSTSTNTDAQLQLFDLFGRKVKVINHITSNTIKMKRENLPDGIYSVMLVDENHRIVFSGKVIIQ